MDNELDYMELDYTDLEMDIHEAEELINIKQDREQLIRDLLRNK